MRLLLLAVCTAAALFAQSKNSAANVDVSISLRRSFSGSYEFVVRNAGSAPVFYGGYDQTEEGSPHFGVQIFRDGMWKDASIGWCGVGACECYLRPQSTLRGYPGPAASFEITPGEKFRIVMGFASAAHVEGRPRSSMVVYSNEIVFTPPKEKKG